MPTEEEKRLLLQLPGAIRSFVGRQLEGALEDQVLEDLTNTLDDLLWERRGRRLEAKRERERASIPVAKGRELVEVREVGKVTYRLEKVRCGKARCRCARGAAHGPYWYAYYRDKGARLRSTYVGKTFHELAPP